MKSSQHLGLAGFLAHAFIRSKLTPLLVVSSLLLGGFALVQLPREEEPQINVPMFDIFVPFPGASAKEVEARVINVGERKLWEIPDVEYIYSIAEPGFAFFIVRFKVGTDPEEAMTRVYTKTFANAELLALGTQPPLIKPRSIDDVPILSLTLWSSEADSFALRKVGARLQHDIAAVNNVSETSILGGHRRQFLVHFDPDQLLAHRLTPLEIAGILGASNSKLPAGHINQNDHALMVETDSFIRSVEDLKHVVIGVSHGRSVVLSDVAKIVDGPDEDERAVFYQPGPRHEPVLQGRYAAVTLAVSKRRGANATHVADDVLARVERLRSSLIPENMKLTVTRNYGETAKQKSDELIFHMFLATISVTVLIWFFLGIREALVVLVAIPVTLALTLLVYFLSGYTLNRITLFALIFSIGILVDDAIVVVENIHRHFMMKDGRTLWDLSVDAVAEVGNPTFLATWTVIAAILPMAFVSGLMGPYMRPIPVGASVAMVFSLLVAFVISPWAFSHLLRLWKPLEINTHSQEGKLDRLYKTFMYGLLNNSRTRLVYFLAMAFLLVGSISLIFVKAVSVKMLPFDNKDEIEIVLNMPEGTSLSKTKMIAEEMSDALTKTPEVKQVVSYVGVPAPYNFNGLVRHYFLRQAAHQADMIVNLSDRHDRKRQSHEIAKEIRLPLQQIADRVGARIQVAEVPPGPPVLSTLVFEIYGPDESRRNDFARKIQELLKETKGIVDVDSYVPVERPLAQFTVNREKATLNGISAAALVQTIQMAIHGHTVGIAHVGDEPEPVELRVRLPEPLRTNLEGTERIHLLSRNGTPIPIKNLTRVIDHKVDKPIHHKNLQSVSYVIADVAGEQESPVYAILDLRKKIQNLARESGIDLKEYFTTHPKSSQEWALKWDGEWHITYEVFRDMGIAFALVLVLIYILVVAWFRSFVIPIVIMIPIPLTLVGILPAHWAMGAFFTATSMIGFIAGAGIVVRNSIILVDFIQLRLKEGMSLKDAVVDAGAVRFRPMLLTAAAVVVGAGVILFDPIFQGLAISLIAGEVASTLLSRTAVPVLYYLFESRSPAQSK